MVVATLRDSKCVRYLTYAIRPLFAWCGWSTANAEQPPCASQARWQVSVAIESIVLLS